MQVVLSHMQVIGVYLKQSGLGIGKKTSLKKNQCTSTLGYETNTIVDKHLIQ